MKKICMLFASLIVASPAYSDERCIPWDDLREGMQKTFGQIEVGGGFIDSNAVITVFATPGGAEWTLAAHRADGLACVLSTGTDWFHVSVPSANEGRS